MEFNFINVAVVAILVIIIIAVLCFTGVIGKNMRSGYRKEEKYEDILRNWIFLLFSTLCISLHPFVL